jgi:hypothetical protein
MSVVLPSWLFNSPLTGGQFVIDCRPADKYAKSRIASSFSIHAAPESNPIAQLKWLWTYVYNEWGLDKMDVLILVGDGGGPGDELVAAAAAALPNINLAESCETVTEPVTAKAVYILAGGFDAYNKSYPFQCGPGLELENLPYAYPSEVTPQLYLSGKGASMDPLVMKHLGITHIVNCTQTEKNYHEWVKYLRLAIVDDPEQKISDALDLALPFIADALAGDATAKVLVHCNQGKSRSVSVIVAHLMRTGELRCCGYDEVLAHVRKCRPIATPNPSFAAQLRCYHPPSDSQSTPLLS